MTPNLFQDPNQFSMSNEAQDAVLGSWVYCSQHLRAHTTGWCTVAVLDKVGLGNFEGDGSEQFKKATEKCRYLGLKLHQDIKDKS